MPAGHSRDSGAIAPNRARVGGYRNAQKVRRTLLSGAILRVQLLRVARCRCTRRAYGADSRRGETNPAHPHASRAPPTCTLVLRQASRVLSASGARRDRSNDGFTLQTVIFREEDHRLAIEPLEEREEVGRLEMSEFDPLQEPQELERAPVAVHVRVEDEVLRLETAKMSEELDLTKRVIQESEAQNRLELSRLQRREVVEHVASEEFAALGRDPHSAHVVERACNQLRSAFDSSHMLGAELQAGERKTHENAVYSSSIRQVRVWLLRIIFSNLQTGLSAGISNRVTRW